MNSTIKNQFDALTQMQKVLAILQELTGELSHTIYLAGHLKIYNPFENYYPGTLFRVFHKNILLSVCSWLDEYHLFFSPGLVEKEYSDRIMQVKKRMQPYLKEINVWKGLKHYRNTIIAHNYRSKREFIHTGGKTAFKVPHKMDDIYHLVICVFEIQNYINEEFKDINPNLYFTSHEGIEKSQVRMRTTQDEIEFIISMRKKIWKTTGFLLTSTGLSVHIPDDYEQLWNECESKDSEK